MGVGVLMMIHVLSVEGGDTDDDNTSDHNNDVDPDKDRSASGF